MATIKKYTKKDGSTAYMFNAYLGIDPLTGKSKRTTRRGFRTQKDAKLALSRLELEIETKGLAKQNFSTFKDVYELWYTQYVNTVKPSTSSNIESIFRLRILPTFGSFRINKITKTMCQNAVNQWSKELASFRSTKIMCNKLFEYAVAQDIISSNPMSYVVMPKINSQPKEQQKFLELKELKTFLKNAKKTLTLMDYLILRVLSFTGMRKGELYPLTWADIDLSNKTINISKAMYTVKTELVITEPKTKASNRIIAIDDKTNGELISWKRKQKEELLKRGKRVQADKEQLVFHKQNNSLLYSEYINCVLTDKMKSNLSPHSFRHTHASLLFESGASIKDVQKRLGHSNVSVTMDIYTHVTKVSEDKMINNINKQANF